MFALLASILLQLATLSGGQPTSSNGADGGFGGWGHDRSGTPSTALPSNAAEGDGGFGGWGHDINGK